jgi:hypothetical protein
MNDPETEYFLGARDYWLSQGLSPAEASDRAREALRARGDSKRAVVRADAAEPKTVHRIARGELLR